MSGNIIQSIYNLVPSGGNALNPVLDIDNGLKAFSMNISNYTLTNSDILIWFFDDTLADELTTRTKNILIQDIQNIGNVVLHHFKSSGFYRIRCFLKTETFVLEKRTLLTVTKEGNSIYETSEGISIVPVDVYGNIYYTTDGTVSDRYKTNLVYTNHSSYVVGDVVESNDNKYRCIDNSDNVVPGTNQDYWLPTNVQKYTGLITNYTAGDVFNISIYSERYNLSNITYTALNTPLYVTKTVSSNVIYNDTYNNTMVKLIPNRDSMLVYTITNSDGSNYFTESNSAIVVSNKSFVLTYHASASDNVNSIEYTYSFDIPVLEQLTYTLDSVSASMNRTLSFDSSTEVRIYYTLDGSTPSVSSSLYINPITGLTNEYVKYMYITLDGYYSDTFIIDSTGIKITFELVTQDNNDYVFISTNKPCDIWYEVGSDLSNVASPNFDSTSYGTTKPYVVKGAPIAIKAIAKDQENMIISNIYSVAYNQ